MPLFLIFKTFESTTSTLLQKVFRNNSSRVQDTLGFLDLNLLNFPRLRSSHVYLEEILEAVERGFLKNGSFEILENSQYTTCGGVHLN